MATATARYDFSDAAVLVTGGTSGIGLATATAFEEAGARVTITGIPDEPGMSAQILGALGDDEINIDMIVSNIAHDGYARHSFTMHTNDLGRAQAALELAELVVEQPQSKTGSKRRPMSMSRSSPFNSGVKLWMLRCTTRRPWVSVSSTAPPGLLMYTEISRSGSGRRIGCPSTNSGSSWMVRCTAGSR